MGLWACCGLAMRMALKLVIFDMDGVLLFSKQLYLEAFRKELAPYGIDYTEKMLDAYEADPKNPNAHRAVIAYTLPPERKKDAPLVADRAEEFMTKNWKRIVKPAPGAGEAMLGLKARGIKVVVATNANYDYAVAALEWMGIGGLPDFVVTEKEGFEDKADALKHAMGRIGAKPDETVYIGDVMADVLVAKRAGCGFVGFVGGRFNTKEQLESVGAEKVVSSMKELAKALR